MLGDDADEAPPSTTGRQLILRSRMMRIASSVVCLGETMIGSGIITSLTAMGFGRGAQAPLDQEPQDHA